MPIVYKDGKWQRGKASPEHLREDLRALPGKFVTKDTGDPDKIHELDDPHIVSALTREQWEEEAKESKPPSVDEILGRIPIGDRAPLRQDRIDVEKFFVWRGVIQGQLRELQQGERLEPDLEQLHWLEFPDDNVNNYIVHEGKPPPDSERPEHTKGWDLVVDIMNPPRSVMDKLEATGSVQAKFARKLLKFHRHSSIIEVPR